MQSYAPSTHHQPQQQQAHAHQQQQQHQQQSQHQQQQHSHQQHQQHQQQQAHQQQQYTHHYEPRKQPQVYNSQQSRRKYVSDYGNSGSNYQQHQSHAPGNNDSAIQTTKSMSWTNSAKKSTASVAVTATPTANNSNISINNNKQSNSSYNHSTKTYTNQQHHYQQQQQQHNHYQQPQMRSYGAMKMPSSPIATSAPPTVSAAVVSERNNSQVEPPKLTNNIGSACNNSNSGNLNVQTTTTSTASTTAAPHQFSMQPQQQHHQHQYQHSQQQHPTHGQTPMPNAAVPLSDSHKQYPGFTHKKPTVPVSSAIEVSLAPPMNLAPPISNAPNNSNTPGTHSWASLFDNKSISSSGGNIGGSSAALVAGTSVTIASQTANNTINVGNAAPAYPPPFTAKKPIAKVAPYEGNTPVIPAPPIVTPGAMSYSAASAQGLPPMGVAPTSKPAGKFETTPPPLSNRNSAHLDEWTLKYTDFLTKYKTDLSPISLRSRGLTNRSNYCYINSILQALLGCSPFYNLMRALPKQAAALSDVKTPTVNAMINFMSHFSNLPSGMRLRTTKGPKGKDELGPDLQCDSAFEPTDIYKLWNDSREEHVEGRQEDAEEFLGYVLNKLNDEMLEVIKLITKPNTEQNGQTELSENEDGDVWQMICNNRNKGSVTRQSDFGRTPLSDIFRGELRSRLQREGEHSTDVIQPFYTLQLNIEKAASVKEALEILVGRDQLEGVTGSKTKQEVVAWQQITLEKLPVVLILHLKWFDYRSDGCTKILKKVEFPVELKIDAKILASKKYSQKQRAYRLFAVVYHDGKEASKGHYITDVFHTGYGSWLRYDDSSVKPVNENHVLLPRAPRVPYLLYYRRSDTLPQPNASTNNAAFSSPSSSTGQSGK